MDQVITSVIAQWGVFGAIIIAAGYIIYDNIKNNHKKINLDGKLDKLSDIVSKYSIENIDIKRQLNDLTIKTNNINCNEDIKDYIDDLTKKINNLEVQIKSHISELNDNNHKCRKNHTEKLINRVSIAPKIHRILATYYDRIHCDHILLGYFHNGTSTVSGIPFYKFDLVAEKYTPGKSEHDAEFINLYKDVDILSHDRLPIELLQNKQVYYSIDENGDSILKDIDEILYHRLIGRCVKQIAFNILKDHDENLEGFVCCIKYDYKEVNLKELKNCARELEDLYNNAKL